MPGRVAALAAAEGRPIRHAVAAAGGARLVETASNDSLRALLADVDWNAVVLQEFSKTALRPWDRWASKRTIADLAALARPAAVVVAPSWPYAPGHSLYSGETGWFEAAPAEPEDFAARNEGFFGSVAAEHGLIAAPVGRAWLRAVAEGRQVYAEDGQHASAEGAALAAGVLWESILYVLDAGS